MDGRTKVNKQLLTEEGRFILANVITEAKLSRKHGLDDIRGICEGAVTVPFAEYISFLESDGFLRRNAGSGALEVTSEGARVANGDSLGDFGERAVVYFKTRTRGQGDEGMAASTSPAGAVAGKLPEIDEHYQVLAALGSGGIGTVYRARHAALDRDVALKEIRSLFDFFNDLQRQEVARRFTEVVQAAARLSHPNIAPIHDINAAREFPYVISELAVHGSARRLIADATEIPVSLSLRYLLQALHALRVAHRAGVHHRGLKPENLLIDAHGNIKLSDFGFQRIVERDDTIIRQVYVGIGSVAYMAPELFTDPSGAGAQADIYALGILFYELITRRLPGRRSPMPSEVEPAVPVAIDDIFDRMTRDSCAQRYARVDDILADLDDVQNLAEVMEMQAQLARADNPLDGLAFVTQQESTTAAPASHDSATVAVELRDAAGTAEPSEPPSGDDDDASFAGRHASKKQRNRPYLFQQRQRKKK